MLDLTVCVCVFSLSCCYSPNQMWPTSGAVLITPVIGLIKPRLAHPRHLVGRLGQVLVLMMLTKEIPIPMLHRAAYLSICTK